MAGMMVAAGITVVTTAVMAAAAVVTIKAAGIKRLCQKSLWRVRL